MSILKLNHSDRHLDAAASASMLASRRIFLAKDCREWNPSSLSYMHAGADPGVGKGRAQTS